MSQLIEFIGHKGGYNLYSFDCPCCGASGEAGILADSTRRIAHGCGQLFIQERARGMFGKPRLLEVNQPGGTKMKKGDVKKGSVYESSSGSILECLDLGEARFPRIPSFLVLYPARGQERLAEPRQLVRELSSREAEEYRKVR